jgi:predicted phage terminase large subunit-like protein
MIKARDIEVELIRRECLESTLYLTRYLFRKVKNEKFIVSDHHKIICDALDKVYAGEITRLIINIAPRYTKTELAVKSFIKKGLAHNSKAKFIHLSYSDDLALDNSEQVREVVKHEAYQEIFPNVKVKKSTDSKKKWYTEDGGGVYATSTAGQVTGFGAGKVEGTENLEGEEDLYLKSQEAEDLMDAIGELDQSYVDSDSDHEGWQDVNRFFGGAIIIDDPLKPEDAESEQIRTKINKRFDSTIRSRVNSRNTPIILIMQRLHPDDLAGYVQKQEPGVWTVISLPSIKKDGTALWPAKHTIEELRELERIDKITFQRQHMQNPKPREGLLYKDFKTYATLPESAAFAKIHVDVADTGDDNLCAVAYKVINNLAYLLDVIHTKERAEVTEQATAKMAGRHLAELCRVESNNGGRFFGRNTEAICRAGKNYKTLFEYYTQRKNKESRILNNASSVNNFFIMPQGWENLFPSFYNEVSGYMAVGANATDDGPDTLTAIYEHEVVRAEVGYKRKN